MCCHPWCCCKEEEEEVRKSPPPTPRQRRAALEAYQRQVRQKEWDALYARPIVDKPPSKPSMDVCEPKPAEVPKPTLVEAKSVQLTLSDTQTDKTVIKDGAVRGAGDGEVRTAVQRSVASAPRSAYFSAGAGNMPQSKL